MAVFTKIDMMDKGTNARKLLDSKEVKAKLGVIGVVNRSQKDINEKTASASKKFALSKEFIFHVIISRNWMSPYEQKRNFSANITRQSPAAMEFRFFPNDSVRYSANKKQHTDFLSNN
jgi:hypothetical protein